MLYLYINNNFKRKFLSHGCHLLQKKNIQLSPVTKCHSTQRAQEFLGRIGEVTFLLVLAHLSTPETLGVRRRGTPFGGSFGLLYVSFRECISLSS